MAVVRELQRKTVKARGVVSDGGDAREAVVEVEQAADSAKAAAEAGLPDEAWTAVPSQAEIVAANILVRRHLTGHFADRLVAVHTRTGPCRLGRT